MGKIIRITFTLLLVIQCGLLFGQQPDTLRITQDTTAIDSVFLINEPDFSGNSEEILLEKMDSLENSWFVGKVYNTGSNETTFSGPFPKDLPDSVYSRRLKDIEQVIPLTYNEGVKKFIKLYTEKSRKKSGLIVGLSDYYFPIFEQALDKYNLPLELKYLPVIESALNPVIKSRAGAQGLWQFMIGTGKMMNLEITSLVDERNDPVKATEAAVRYLKKLYSIYHDWHLAIAAYNCGDGNVNRAIKRAGNKTNYWQIYNLLPRETRDFVPFFIAATYMMNYHEEHNITPVTPQMSLETDTLWIDDYLHLNQVAAVLNIEIDELRFLNPSYKKDIIPAKPEKPYALMLPKEKMIEFLDKENLIFAIDRDTYFKGNEINKLAANANAEKAFEPIDIKGMAKVHYLIKDGDNLGFISSWFNVRSADISDWNNISRNRIRAGRTLIIYVPEKLKSNYERLNIMSFDEKQATVGKGNATAQTFKPAVLNITAEYEYYEVRKGDTPGGIANQFGIKTKELMTLNNLSSAKGLQIGQKLKIRKKS